MKLQIIELNKNPKRKNKTRKVKRKTKARRKKHAIKIRKVKRNPPKRKRMETVIVGYSGRGTPTKIYGSKNSTYYKLHRRKKTQRWYYTGKSFSRKREDAEIFPGDAAKAEMKRIEYRLPWGIYSIAVENA